MIRAGGYQGPGSVHTRGMRVLTERLPLDFEENVTSDGSKATALLERTEAGTLDLCYFASSYLAERVPALLALDLPFSFGSREEAYAAVDGEVGKRLAEEVAGATRFAVLAFWDNGFRHLSNGVRPLVRPADCAGLRLRTLDNRLHQDVFRAFGFEPMMIDVRDLPAAVAEGRVDAQENPLTNTVNFGLHRTHRFHSLTGHVFGVALLLANRGWFEALPDGERAALAEAVAEATAAQRRFAAEEDARCLEVLARDGAAVLGPEELDLAAFREAAAPVRDAALGAIRGGA